MISVVRRIDSSSLDSGSSPMADVEPINEAGESSVLSAVDPSLLNEVQCRAYEIVVWHLDQLLAGRNPSPLRKIIHGEGGMGKSKVLQTVTETYWSKLLTGVAASETHTIARTSSSTGRFDGEDCIGNESRVKLEEFMAGIPVSRT